MQPHTPNYQDQELNKFSKLAMHWWDPELECKPLHAINPLRVSFIKSHCQLKDKTILDVGCGGGILTEALAREGGNATGIDLAEELIQVANLHLLESKLKVDYQTIAVEQLALQYSNHFDIITCMELLEHTSNPQAIIQAIARLLKPGGKVFFSTLNRNYKSYLQAILVAEYLLRLLPVGTHDYAHFIKPSELDREARKNDLSLKAITGLSYDLLRREYYLTDNIDVNYLVCYEK
jgi:2-polyprenyl-6-hydroxyphenyl methylase/3-demethylubiquinone-9 3-methyltransferase